MEDRLKRITADARDARGPRHEEPTLAAIDRTLLALDVPNEEWDILYRLRLQAERDLLRRALGGTAVIDPLTIDATERSDRRRARRRRRTPTRAARRPGPRAVTATPIPVQGRSESDVRAGTPSMLWPVLAILGLVSFVALTVALASGVVFPFDRPLLDVAKAWGRPRITWDVVSQSANFPLIFLGVGFVLWLLWQHRYREAVLGHRGPCRRHRRQRGREAAHRQAAPGRERRRDPGRGLQLPVGPHPRMPHDPGHDRPPPLADDATPPARRPCRRPRRRGDRPRRHRAGRAPGALSDGPPRWPVRRDRGAEPLCVVHPARRMGGPSATGRRGRNEPRIPGPASATRGTARRGHGAGAGRRLDRAAATALGSRARAGDGNRRRRVRGPDAPVSWCSGRSPKVSGPRRCSPSMRGRARSCTGSRRPAWTRR